MKLFCCTALPAFCTAGPVARLLSPSGRGVVGRKHNNNSICCINASSFGRSRHCPHTRAGQQVDTSCLRLLTLQISSYFCLRVAQQINQVLSVISFIGKKEIRLKFYYTAEAAIRCEFRGWRRRKIARTRKSCSHNCCFLSNKCLCKSQLFSLTHSKYQNTAHFSFQHLDTLLKLDETYARCQRLDFSTLLLIVDFSLS